MQLHDLQPHPTQCEKSRRSDFCQVDSLQERTSFAAFLSPRHVAQDDGDEGPKRPHKHKGSTKHDFWYPPYDVPKSMFIWSFGPLI